MRSLPPVNELDSITYQMLPRSKPMAHHPGDRPSILTSEKPMSFQACGGQRHSNRNLDSLLGSVGSFDAKGDSRRKRHPEVLSGAGEVQLCW